MRALGVVAMLAITVVTAVSPEPSHNTTHRTHFSLLVADQSRGLLSLSFNPSKAINESVCIVDETDAGFEPNWLTPSGNRIYSISRSKYPDESSRSGGLFEFAKIKTDEDQGSSLALLSSASSNGSGGVHVEVHKTGRLLAAANIDGSTISIHPLDLSGTIGTASHTFEYLLETPGPGTNDSQIASNPHQATFEPSGQYMFVPDRGADRLYIYGLDKSFQMTLEQNISLPSGTGPRHIAFKPYNATRTMAYLVGELDNTLRVLSIDGVQNEGFGGYDSSHHKHSDSIRIELLQVASTLQPGSARTAPDNHDLAAEVNLSNDGNFAYVSNRNTESLDPDNITVFAVDAQSSTSPLTWVGRISTHGKIPRHFSLSPDAGNRYIAIANQVSRTIVILGRNETSGFADEVVGRISLGEFDLSLALGPFCVIWDQMKHPNPSHREEEIWSL